MKLEVIWDEHAHAANVLLDGREIFGPEQVILDPMFLAFLDGEELTGVEVIDTRRFGTPFDEGAAARAVAWAREQLANFEVV